MKEFICNDDRPHFPDGEYESQCVGYNTNFCFGKTRKTFLEFVNWVMVNSWNKPSRNAKMSPRIFKNKIYKIKTRTTKPKHNGKDMPENFWYSVVDEILEVIA
jgi:hypothetical protein